MQVDRFADSNDLFYNVFAHAMKKVIENTKGVELYEVGGRLESVQIQKLCFFLKHFHISADC